MAVCDDDRECPGTLICYKEPTWNDGVTLCTCSHWYGWQGSACDELGPASYFLIATSSITLCIAAVLGGIATITLVQYARAVGLKGNAQVATMMFVWMTCLSVIVWRCLVLVQVSTPTGNTLEIQANRENKVHQVTPYERGSITVSLLFNTLTMLNVSLMWVEVAVQSQRMTRAAQRNVTAYRKTIYSFEVLWVIGLVAIMSVGLTAFAFIFATPFLIFIIVTYAYGAHKMSSLLLSVGAAVSGNNGPGTPRAGESGTTRRTNSRYDALIRRIRRTAVAVVVSLLAGFVFVAIYSLLTILPADGSRSVINPDNSVHFVVFSLEMLPYSMLAATAAVLVYLRHNIRGTVQATSGAGSKQELAAGSGQRETSSSSFENTNTYAFSTFRPATPKESI